MALGALSQQGGGADALTCILVPEAGLCEHGLCVLPASPLYVEEGHQATCGFQELLYAVWLEEEL